jgi:hypothetical protein
VRLTTSLKVGAKYLGCVVCRFHVTAGAGSAPCQKPVSFNLQKWFIYPTGRFNFGFITKGKLTAVLITPSSWGSQQVANHAPTSFLAPLLGRKRISARGASHFQYFYFVIFWLSFFTLFQFASFYQKYKIKLVHFIVVILLYLF